MSHYLNIKLTRAQVWSLLDMIEEYQEQIRMGLKCAEDEEEIEYFEDERAEAIKLHDLLYRQIPPDKGFAGGERPRR
jgi:hypothetical protein